MSEIIAGFQEAIQMLLSGDSEIFGIISLSLFVSFNSVLISSCLGIPLGMIIGTYQFRLKKILLRIIYTMMSFPPVIAGLIVFLFIMRKGPLGSLGLTYTPTAMIIAQVCLVTPIITGFTYNVVSDHSQKILNLSKILGGNRLSHFKLLLFEMRVGILAAVVAGFGRAVSEVGAVMIVGGNIQGRTRVMTTYIAQLQNMGNYSRAIAVGIVLLIIAFVTNTVLYHFQIREKTL